MGVLLNVDQLTNYRKKQIEIINTTAQKLKASFYLLANSKKKNKLPLINKFINNNLIKSEPINVGKYCIWQPKLISSIFLKKPKLAIIWGEVTRINSWVILILKKLRIISTDITLWTHGIYGRENYFLKKIRLLYLSLADYILVYTFRSKELLVLNGISKKKIIVIGNSIENINKYKIRESIKTNKECLNIIFIGRNVVRRKLDILEEIIKKWDEDFYLNYIFIGPEIILKKERTYKSSKSIYLPEIYDPNEIQEYLNWADFGICPDYIGLFCITCLNSGLPLICNSDVSNHGPEASALMPNINSIEIERPISISTLKESLKKAYQSKLNHKFESKAVYKSLKIEFHQEFIEKSIKSFIEERLLS